MADFWGKLGNVVPKKGYSKYGKSIDKKVRHASKSAAKTRRANVSRIKKQNTKKSTAMKRKQKSNIRFPGERDAKWRPYLTFTSKEKALSMARHLRETDSYPTRVDGTGRGYQVWIKS